MSVSTKLYNLPHTQITTTLPIIFASLIGLYLILSFACVSYEFVSILIQSGIKSLIRKLAHIFTARFTHSSQKTHAIQVKLNVICAEYVRVLRSFPCRYA